MRNGQVDARSGAAARSRTRAKPAAAHSVGSLLVAVRVELEAQLTDVTRRREKLMDGAFDADLAAAATRIAAAIVDIHKEQRLTAKAEQGQLDKLTPGAIVAALHRLDRHEREHVARELELMTRSNRLFG